MVTWSQALGDWKFYSEAARNSYVRYVLLFIDDSVTFKAPNLNFDLDFRGYSFFRDNKLIWDIESENFLSQSNWKIVMDHMSPSGSTHENFLLCVFTPFA